MPDLRLLRDDLAARPRHYNAEQHETFAQLERGDATTSTARSTLFLQYMRQTEAQRAEQATRRALTGSMVRPEQEPPPFEQQDLFRGAIKLA